MVVVVGMGVLVSLLSIAAWWCCLARMVVMSRNLRFKVFAGGERFASDLICVRLGIGVDGFSSD